MHVKKCGKTKHCSIQFQFQSKFYNLYLGWVCKEIFGSWIISRIHIQSHNQHLLKISFVSNRQDAMYNRYENLLVCLWVCPLIRERKLAQITSFVFLNRDSKITYHKLWERFKSWQVSYWFDFQCYLWKDIFQKISSLLDETQCIFSH